MSSRSPYCIKKVKSIEQSPEVQRGEKKRQTWHSVSSGRPLQVCRHATFAPHLGSAMHFANSTLHDWHNYPPTIGSTNNTHKEIFINSWIFFMLHWQDNLPPTDHASHIHHWTFLLARNLWKIYQLSYELALNLMKTFQRNIWSYRHSLRRQPHVFNASTANAFDPPHRNSPVAIAATTVNEISWFQNSRLWIRCPIQRAQQGRDK